MISGAPCKEPSSLAAVLTFYAVLRELKFLWLFWSSNRSLNKVFSVSSLFDPLVLQRVYCFSRALMLPKLPAVQLA